MTPSVLTLRPGVGPVPGIHLSTGKVATQAAVAADTAGVAIVAAHAAALLARRLGVSRTGPLAWRSYAAADAAPVVAFLDNGSPLWDALRRILEEHPGSFLVVVSAPVIDERSAN